MIDIEIDALTNSILQAATNQVFETQVIDALPEDLHNLQNWHFNWATETQRFRVFKLTTLGEPQTIQGLISWRFERGFAYVSLVENAPFNIGKMQLYKGVAGNLFACVCKMSFENGFGGYVSFDAKTSLIEHYQKSLKAQLIGGQRMMIETKASLELVKMYYKDF